MKILSIAIPCYNSAAYMRRCIDSLLPGGEDVEILIVDDGSTKDNTAEIADEYEEYEKKAVQKKTDRTVKSKTKTSTGTTRRKS